MLEFCRENKGRIACVVVYNVSRLAREKHDHFLIRALLNRLGITLRSVTEPVDDTATGKFIEGVLAASAQFDNDVKAERTRAGMMAALDQGRWTHQAPLGYRMGGRDGPSLVPDKRYSTFVLWAFEQSAAGQSERDVLKALTARGMRGRHGQPLSAQTLSAMLKNPVYAGRIELSKWGISRAGDWEPIVSRELFSRVQNRRQHRGKGNLHRRQHPDFPLRVFVRCAQCHTPLTGSWSRGRNARYGYYSCRQGGCVRVSRERLESLFVERLRALQPDPDYLRLFNAIVRDVWREQQLEVRRLRETTQRELDVVSRRLDQLESAFIYDRRVDRATYEQQRDKLREESALFELRLHEARIDELDIDALLAFAEHVVSDAARIWSEASMEQRTQLQRVFFPQGLDFDGVRFGTATTCLAFREIAKDSSAEIGVASPTGTADGWPFDVKGFSDLRAA